MPQVPQVVAEAFPQAKCSEFRGQVRIEVEPGEIVRCLTTLKSEGFDFLVDVTCVDYLQYRAERGNEHPARFGLTYLLANTTSAERISLRVYVDDDVEPSVDSIVPIWEGANWLEREVYDMFGIRFTGHPNLSRILMPDEFAAYPLRKDYPLQGRGERHNFPTIARADA